MNRDQKAAAIAEIAQNIQESDAVFAVDYRGISVPQAAELRAKLRAADTRFRVVKNTLTERAADTRFRVVKNTRTERAADQAGADALKPLLEGPTAFAFVRGDAAAAAKAIADYARTTDLLPFKGGVMDGNALSPDEIRAISRLPSRDVLYGQLVGVIAHPISGLARMLNQLIGGLAIALGQIQEKGLVGGDAPAPPEPEAAADQDAGPASTPEETQPDQAGGEDTPAGAEPEASTDEE